MLVLSWDCSNALLEQVGDSKKRSDSTWCVWQKAKAKLVEEVWSEKLEELEEVRLGFCSA